MIRYLAHRVEHAGNSYTMAIVEAFSDSEGCWHVKIYPFEKEIHSTTFHNGTLRIADSTDPTKPFTDGSKYPPAFIK